MAHRWKFAVACAVVLAPLTAARAQSAPAASPLTIFFTAQDASPLTSADLRVTVDKKPVQVLSLRPAKSDKLLFALLIDASGSQMKDARPIRETATQIFQQLSSQGGVGYLGAFSDTFRFSKSPIAAQEVQRLLDGIQFRGGTSLYDAIATCAQQLGRQAHPDFPRRAIILITDGGDNQSHLTQKQAAEAAEREGIAVFSLDTSRGGVPTAQAKDANFELNNMGRDTGGEVVIPRTVATAVTGLLDALEHQWELTIAAPALPSGKLYALSVKTIQKHVQITAPEHITLP